MTSASSLEWVTSISTALAVAVALGGYGFLEWQRRQTLILARRTSAHMIGMRLFRILNHSCDFARHFSSYSENDRSKNGNHLLPEVHPLIGVTFDPMVRLDANEIALLIEAHEAAFLSELLLAGSVYESLVISLNEYRDRYETTYRMIPPPVSMDGKIAAHELSTDEFLKLRPFAVQLSDLIGALRKMTAENVERCKKLSAQYHPIMKKRFKGEKFISFKDIEPPSF